LIDKEEKETSFDVVKKVKSLFKKRKGLKVGHAGTLDPFATGLLVILMGNATKISSFVMSQDKVYKGTMMLGTETDTLDPTGLVVRTAKVPDLNLELIKCKAAEFEGDIEQTPPIYSALKYNGQRAYKLARKGSEVKLQKRRVRINFIKICNFEMPFVSFEVGCSSGTYIRSLAADLGSKLGTVSHLTALRRLKSGLFNVRDALLSKEIVQSSGPDILKGRIVSLRQSLPQMKELEIEEELAARIKTGHQPKWEEIDGSCQHSRWSGGYVKLVTNKNLVAIVKCISEESEDKGHDSLKLERVFV